MRQYFNGKPIESDNSWIYIPPRLNMLINWYFPTAINQGRETSYTTTTRNGFTIDRWKLTSGTLTVNSDGITLNGTLVQTLETGILGGATTATVLASDGPLTSGVAYDNSKKTFTITATNKKLIAAKLEIGTVQTLYHMENGSYVLNDPPPNMAEELLKCQRYLYVIGGDRGVPIGNAFVSIGTHINILSCIPSMRTAPSITYTGRLRFASYSKNLEISSESISKIEIYGSPNMNMVSWSIAFEHGIQLGVIGWIDVTFTSSVARNTYVTFSAEEI